VAGADSVRAVISSLSDRLAAVRVGDRPSQLRAVDLLETMLLRDLCGLSWERVGLATGVALATAHRRYQLHRIELARGGEYASAAVDTAQAVVRRFVTQ
jgi:hypothetical protein